MDASTYLAADWFVRVAMVRPAARRGETYGSLVASRDWAGFAVVWWNRCL